MATGESISLNRGCRSRFFCIDFLLIQYRFFSVKDLKHIIYWRHPKILDKTDKFMLKYLAIYFGVRFLLGHNVGLSAFEDTQFIPKLKLRFQGHQISRVSDCLSIRDFSAWAGSATEAAKETKFGTKVA